MNDPDILPAPHAELDLGRILSQRRAFAAVGGRCSAAHAMLLRRIHDQELYRAVSPSCSDRDRELILESTAELRIILMRPGLD